MGQMTLIGGWCRAVSVIHLTNARLMLSFLMVYDYLKVTSDYF